MYEEGGEGVGEDSTLSHGLSLFRGVCDVLYVRSVR